jgi:hypothetical protein
MEQQIRASNGKTSNYDPPAHRAISSIKCVSPEWKLTSRLICHHELRNLDSKNNYNRNSPLPSQNIISAGKRRPVMVFAVFKMLCRIHNQLQQIQRPINRDILGPMQGWNSLTWWNE